MGDDVMAYTSHTIVCVSSYHFIELRLDCPLYALGIADGVIDEYLTNTRPPSSETIRISLVQCASDQACLIQLTQNNPTP